MTSILVEANEPVDIEDLKVKDEAKAPVKEDNLAALEESIELPEKYRGKSTAEITKMHMEAEMALGRKNNEFGELRKLTDQVIKRQLSEAQAVSAPKERKEVSTEDLLTSPQKAIDDAIASHPRLAAIERMEADLISNKAAQALGAFKEKHPDFQEVGNSEEFLKYVDETPGRKKLYQQAAYNYDFDVADELLTQFKQAQKAKVKSIAKEQQKTEIKQLAKSAVLETATTGDSSKKIFRRRDLIDMAASNPQKYYEESFQAEVQQAYQEGRVK